MNVQTLKDPPLSGSVRPSGHTPPRPSEVAMCPTVLVVDDEKNILLTLSQSLQLAGYRTEPASSGQVALDVVAAKPVDVVLMDVKMPDMDGLTALAKLMEARPNLPVIMMSGHGTI